MKLISACLLGLNCKYNGENNLNEKVLQLGNDLIPVCPEQLGGLATPRPPCEIIGGDGHDVLRGTAKVVTQDGNDVTAFFVAGAEMCSRIAEITKAKEAVLKCNSPSCGAGTISDGTFSNRKRNGDGVTAALLKQKGIKVITEVDLEK